MKIRSRTVKGKRLLFGQVEINTHPKNINKIKVRQQEVTHIMENIVYNELLIGVYKIELKFM